jgi:hypothetical protein
MADRRGQFGGRLAEVPQAQEFLDAYQLWQSGGMKQGQQPMPQEYIKELAGFAGKEDQDALLRELLEMSLRERYKEFYPDMAGKGGTITRGGFTVKNI